jgi:hypothetical protein
LADEFVSKLRAGLSPSIEQYALDHPKHASIIRSVFPSLVIVEKLSAKDATEPLDSTLALAKSGKVISNLMVDLNPSNQKLRGRAVQIVRELAGCTEAAALDALEHGGWVVKDAVRALKRK